MTDAMRAPFQVIGPTPAYAHASDEAAIRAELVAALMVAGQRILDLSDGNVRDPALKVIAAAVGRAARANAAPGEQS